MTASDALIVQGYEDARAPTPSQASTLMQSVKDCRVSPQGIITVPNVLTAQEAEQLKEQWLNARGGEVMVLSGGAEYRELRQ